MLNISTKFKQELYYDRRNYQCRASITLADGTNIEVDNEHIMGSGLSIEDTVSDDNSFSAIGATVINSTTLVLYNNDESFSDYEFEGAEVIIYVGLLIDSQIEEIRRGVYTVDEPTYGSSTITLTMLDNMSKFDKPYTLSSLQYPATLSQIVRDACTVCGVSYNAGEFPNFDYIVSEKPTTDALTFREVISWCAMISGRFAKCDVYGQLIFGWFDIDALNSDSSNNFDGGEFDDDSPYSTGDSVDGGTFNPWNDGDEADGGSFTETSAIHYISTLYSQKFSVDDVVITGVKVTINDTSVSTSSTPISYSAGTDGYVLEFSNNKFITSSTGQSVCNYLASILVGLQFRPCNVTCSDNPSIEAGDVALIWDTKGIQHPILITRTVFAPGKPQTVVCGAETPSRNSSTRYSQQAKAYIETREEFIRQKTAYELALQQLSERLANASGLFETRVQQPDGSYVIYYHNKSNLSDSDIQMVISDVGITVTPNGTNTNPTWYGLTVDGQLIASIMNTIGINFDWGVGGELIIKKNNQETLYVNATTGEVRIVANTFSLSNGDTINSIAESAANDALTDAKAYTDIAETNAINTASADATNKANGAIATANGYTDAQISDYATQVDAAIEDIQDQIDGVVDTYYYNYEPTSTNYPANEWLTEADKEEHEGDLFLDTSTGKSYRWVKENNVWQWKEIPDTASAQALQKAQEALDAANGKRRVFVAEPYTPYDVGDLWVQGNTGDIKVCTTARTTGNYVANDWVLASKYTDDSAVAALNTSLNQSEIFNRLTNNGEEQGIYLSNGKLYINGEYIRAGSITVIGSLNDSAIYLDTDSIKGTGKNGTDFFEFSGSGATESTSYTKIINILGSEVPISQSTAKSFALDYYSNLIGAINIFMNAGDIDSGTTTYEFTVDFSGFTYGTAQTMTKHLSVTYMDGGEPTHYTSTKTITLIYDGDVTFTYYASESLQPELKNNETLEVTIYYNRGFEAPGYVFGTGTSSDAYALAIGRETEASGDASFAGGYKSKATKTDSFAFGNQAESTNNYAIALGNSAKATGIASFAVHGTANANYAYSIGGTASGLESIAIGHFPQATKQGAIAIGREAEATAQNAIAIGDSYANATGSVAIGNAEAGYDYQIVLGRYNDNKSYTVLEIGNGSDESNPSNAFEVDWSGSARLYNKTANVDTFFRVTRTDVNRSVAFGIGSGGENHGIYTNINGRWMIYEDTSGILRIPASDIRLMGHSSSIGRVPSVNSNSGDVSLPSGTSKALCSILLTPGSWVIIGKCRFSRNENGSRILNISTTSADNQIHVRQAAAPDLPTDIQIMHCVQITADTRYYLNAQQTSGNTLTVPSGFGTLRVIRIA